MNALFLLIIGDFRPLSPHSRMSLAAVRVSARRDGGDVGVVSSYRQEYFSVHNIQFLNEIQQFTSPLFYSVF